MSAADAVALSDEIGLTVPSGAVDRAFTLRAYRRAIEVTELDYAEADVVLTSLDQEMSRLETESNARERALHAYSLVLARGVPDVHHFFVKAQARRNVVVSALRMKAFHLRNGHWPNSVGGLTADARTQVDDVGIDPFNGSPLRLDVGEHSVRVYSVGDDLEDNQGNEDWDHGGVDIVAEIRP